MSRANNDRQAGSQTQRSDDQEAFGFEMRMRELLAEDAYAIRPSPIPYEAIRQQGQVERRRHGAMAALVLVSMVAVSAGAYSFVGGDGERVAHPATRTPSDTGPKASAATSSGPTQFAPGQFLDGITFAQASAGLKECLTAERGAPSARGNAFGEADDYQIILAARSSGGSAAGGNFHVVGVREHPAGMRVVCDIENGEASGISTGTSADDSPDAGPVVPDVNAAELFQPSASSKGSWKLPFRWAVIGTVEPSVTKVSVSYGGATRRAVLDHGWFVASALLHQQATTAPRIKGYSAAGKLLYDSDQDKSWARTLP